MKNKTKIKRFDPILKEIISKSIRKILLLAKGQKIKGKVIVLPEEIRLVKVLRPDVLIEIQNKIIQIEIQAQYDKNLPERMLKYCIAIKEKFGKVPTQIVLFVGKGNPPPNTFKLPNLIFKFKVLDMKKINPDFFIKSNKPEEIILGILAGKYKDKPHILREILKRISEIVKLEEKVIKYIDNLNFLASLFDIKIKLEPMPIQIDITKAPFYKLGEKRGIEKGRLEGLKEGERKGLKEGLKEAILMDIELRFGQAKVKQVKNLLEKINDIRHLRKIKKEVIKAKSWNDFFKFIQNSKKR